MSFQSDFFSWLSTRGSAVGDRFYPSTLPDDPGGLPAATLQKIVGPRSTTQQGRTGMTWPLFQITIYDDDHAGSVDAMEDLILKIEGQRGNIGPGSTYLGGLLIEDTREDKDPENGLYRQIIDARIWYREA